MSNSSSYYVILAKKNYNQKQVFPLNIILDKFLNFCDNNYSIYYLFCNPGYMSTTTRTADSFFSTFKKNHNFIASFASGMNGNTNIYVNKNDIKKYPNASSIVAFYNSRTNGINFNTTNDHSKSILFYNSKGKILAILIGSSNMSYTTYCRKFADKGEFDALIISENFIKTYIENNNIVASMDEVVLDIFGNTELTVTKNISHKNFSDLFKDYDITKYFESINNFFKNLNE